MPNLVTVHREIDFSDDDTTAGEVLDQLLALDFVVAVTFDTRTPSSHSSPFFDVTFRDTLANRERLASFFFDDLADLVFV